jgi:rod shape determining protein RodA
MTLLSESSVLDETLASRNSLLGRFHLDTALVLALLAVCVLGLLILYSAARQDMHLVIRQSIHMGIGFVLMIILAQIPPYQLKYWTPWIFLGGIIMLLAVLGFGAIGKGAQRWLNLGVIRFQPSELMKLTVPMILAWYFSDKPLPPQFRHIVTAALLTVIPCLLILRQPDLGTALLIGLAGAFTLFLAGISWLIIAAVAGLIALVAPLFWMFIMHDYQRQRVLTFLSPETDPLGSGWNIIQSKIAIGSGGIYGKGWLNGTQSHLDFLPEGQTDFIFAAFGEEFGLIGFCLLLLLYFFIIARGLHLASLAPETYSRLLGGSLTLIFFIYVFVNAGMVSGLLPVVGLPLPMISYGGTAIVTILTGFGILMGGYSHRRLLSR